MQRMRRDLPSESSSSDANSPLQVIQSSSSGSRSGLSSRGYELESAGSETKKRSHIRVACNSCRSKKLKCNGDRPACTACQDRNMDCVYESDPSSTRLDNLKRKTAVLEEENQDLRTLVELLRSRPQSEVDNVINRLRLGDEVRSAMEHARPGHVLSRVISDGIDAQSRAALTARLQISEPQNVQAEAQAAVVPHLARQSTGSSQRDKRMDISSVLKGGEEDTPSQPHSRAHPPNQ